MKWKEPKDAVRARSAVTKEALGNSYYLNMVLRTLICAAFFTVGMAALTFFTKAQKFVSNSVISFIVFFGVMLLCELLRPMTRYTLITKDKYFLFTSMWGSEKHKYDELESFSIHDGSEETKGMAFISLFFCKGEHISIGIDDSFPRSEFIQIMQKGGVPYYTRINDV